MKLGNNGPYSRHLNWLEPFPWPALVNVHNKVQYGVGKMHRYNQNVCNSFLANFIIPGIKITDLRNQKLKEKIITDQQMINIAQKELVLQEEMISKISEIQQAKAKITF